MEPWHTPAALAWMQTILQERFGQAFTLQPQANGSGIGLRLPDDAHCVTLALDGVTFTRADSDLPCAQWNASAEGWLTALPGDLPAPGLAQLPAPLMTITENGWHIGYDILGLVHWMLTRQEEMGRTDLDKHGRFPATASHAHQHGYLERPIADEWLDVLRQVIHRIWPQLPLTQPKFTVMVSHDVDNPSRYGFIPWHQLPRCIGGDLLKRQDLRSLLGPWIRLTTRTQLSRSDPFNTFNWLMNVAERNGRRDAFYFICDRRNTPNSADYDVRHPAIRALIRDIRSRGHEVGLHASYASYLEPAQIKKEADRLREVCTEEGARQAAYGGRMHYLQWRQPDTLHAWNDAGMTYDSTLTYADHAGFRCGTCFEYPAFDPVAQEMLKIRIRPLIVMEGSVFGAMYMNLGVTDAARDKMLELKEVCRKVGGCFTLLWHNSSLQTRVQCRLYEVVVQ